MLSAFTARPIVELKTRDKSKIKSILAYGDRLLVGLDTGSLRIYRVNEPSDEPPPPPKQNGAAKIDTKSSSQPTFSSTPQPVDLLRDLDKFSTRAVEQLARIKEANVLISLSNGYVSLHDLQTYALQEQLTKTKSATTFAVTSNIVEDAATGILEIKSRLAVAVKRRLLLWSWHASELSPDLVEVTLAEPIKTLTWASATKIVCGMNSGYVIVDVDTKVVEDIVGPGAIGGLTGGQGGRFGGVGSASMGYMGLGGYIPKPLATKLADGEMLLAKDINSLFITSEGKPLEKRQIPWSQAPESIGYSYPYILALQPASKGILEVRSPETLSLLQSISLPSSDKLHCPPPNVSLAHAGKGFHVASERCIWQMGGTDYDSQVDELVEKGKFDEAISILDMLEDALVREKSGRLREVTILKAQALFDQRKYRDAMEIFLYVEAPPQRVIQLYPKAIAGDLSTIEKTQHLDESDIEESKDTTNGDTAAHDTAPQEVVGSPRPNAVNKLLKAHAKTNSDTSSIRSFMRLDATEPSEGGSTSAKAEDKALEGQDLINATMELCGFLVQSRNKMKRFIDASTGRLIPTTEDPTTQSAIDSLLITPASDAEMEREAQLLRTAKLIDTTLFRAYMLARPALVVSLSRIPNFCDSDVVSEKLQESGRYNDLVDFFHGKKLHRPALELLKKFGTTPEPDENAPSLHGPQRMVGYLQNLPPEMIDLIFEFAEWPLRAEPGLGMEIFLADTENAETLPRGRVVRYLQDINVDLAVRYLEHVVQELNDGEPEFHDMLVEAYFKDLKAREDKGSKEWRGLMGRLVGFLKASQNISLGKAFALIPKDDPEFYEAQAVVLSHMGQHKQALAIYVFDIKDYVKAEEYCNRIHLTQETTVPSSNSNKRSSPLSSDSKTDSSPPSIYHTLLSLYLQPPPPHVPNLPPALALLSRHGSRLPASSTLALLPQDLPIADLESYFRGRIRAANSVVNESRIVLGLRKSELVRAQAGVLLGEDVQGNGSGGGRSRRVVIGEERVCGGCHKRIGRSVIAVLPDGRVVHYGCLGKVDGGGGGSGGKRNGSAVGSADGRW